MRVRRSCACCKAGCWLGRTPRIGLQVMCQIFSCQYQAVRSVPVSPASPLYAIRVCLFSGLVLSSVALRTVGPRIVALEAAMMVKSLPVIPSNTSL